MNRDGAVHFRIGVKKDQVEFEEAVKKSGVNESIFCRTAVARLAKDVKKNGAFVR